MTADQMDAVGPNNRWQLTHTLGAGGFSTVYAAIDTRFESPVAVKILADNHATNIEVRERFLAEALLQRRIPGAVVPVYDTGETVSGQPFIVMALADGGDLETRVERWRPTSGPSDDDVYQLALVLTHAVGALHAHDVVHRDLKPSNLLLFGGTGPTGGGQSFLGPSETLLLADLGFAKNLGDGSGLTVGGGTPGYLPPEQRHPGRVDHRADIWAASAILHWFITGHPPNLSPSIRRNDLEATGVRLSLVDAIEQGMADSTNDRPGTVAQWNQNIRTALLAPAPSSTVVGRSSRRTSWVVLGLAGLALVALAGYGYAAATADDQTSASTRSDGVSTSTVTKHGVSVSLNGPDEITMGDTAVFTADLPPDVSSWIWISPSGSQHPNQADLPIRTTREGSGTVTLVASTTAGKTVIVEHEFEVTSE